ncbi:13316_t:CDS:2, partial [Gigaspora rosea]
STKLSPKSSLFPKFLPQRRFSQRRFPQRRSPNVGPPMKYFKILNEAYALTVLCISILTSKKPTRPPQNSLSPSQVSSPSFFPKFLPQRRFPNEGPPNEGSPNEGSPNESSSNEGSPNNGGLKRHHTVVRGYNKDPSGIYKLPLKAGLELKKIFVKIIQDRLKAHFTSSGSQRVLMPCILSQFYSVFKGHIHRRFSKSGRVRCLFQGNNAYSLLGQILNNEQWGVKYFSNGQRTYVTFQPPRERALGSMQKKNKPKIKQVV